MIVSSKINSLTDLGESFIVCEGSAAPASGGPEMRASDGPLHLSVSVSLSLASPLYPILSRFHCRISVVSSAVDLLFFQKHLPILPKGVPWVLFLTQCIVLLGLELAV